MRLLRRFAAMRFPNLRQGIGRDPDLHVRGQGGFPKQFSTPLLRYGRRAGCSCVRGESLAGGEGSGGGFAVADVPDLLADLRSVFAPGFGVLGVVIHHGLVECGEGLVASSGGDTFGEFVIVFEIEFEGLFDVVVDALLEEFCVGGVLSVEVAHHSVDLVPVAGGDGFAAVVEDDGALECAESAFVKPFGDIPIGANPAAPRCGVAFAPDDSSFVEGGVEGLGSGVVAVAGGEGCLGALDLLFPFKELGLDIGGALGSSLGGRGEEKDDFHDEGCREGDAEMASEAGENGG